jgi:hypothetical protein
MRWNPYLREIDGIFRYSNNLYSIYIFVGAMLDSQNSNGSWEMEAGRCDHCALCPIWRWMTFAVLSPDISVCTRVLDFSQSTISCRILFSQVPSFHMVSGFWRGQLQTVWEGCASLCRGYMYVDRIWYIWTDSMPIAVCSFLLPHCCMMTTSRKM